MTASFDPIRTRRLIAVAPEAIRTAAEILLGGGLVAFPTETVYGLGALGLSPAAVERIFEAKERPHSDPLILHVAEAAAARPLVSYWPGLADRLVREFWPGPLTLVLPKSDRVPARVTAGEDSVAVRVPAHPVALELLRAVGQPVAAPSANRFGRTSPTTAAHVLQDLEGRIDAVLDGGATMVGVESTVLDIRGPEPLILRPGGVTREMLETLLERPVALRGEQEDGGLRSPGLLTRHYSPRAEVCLFAGADPAVLEAIRRLAASATSEAPLAVLAYHEDLLALEGTAAHVVDLGPRSDLRAAAHRLYAALRAADEAGAVRIAARLAPAGNLGDALNDRLLRAAAGRIFRIE